MGDFTKHNTSTHPIWYLESDLNSVLDHGLVKPCSRLIRKNGDYYEAIHGDTGNLEFGGEDNEGATDGTDAAAVIHAAWGAMTAGGRIHARGTIALGSNPLSLTLTKQTKALILTGEGESATKFTYAGDGPAVTITTDDGAVGYYNFCLSDFQIDCTTKTAGRDGLAIDKVGRTGVLNHVIVRNTDVAFDIGANPNDTNEVYLYDCAAETANVGLQARPAATNEIAAHNFRAVDTSTYGAAFYGGTSARLYGGLFAPSGGTGLYLYAMWAPLISGTRFEPSATIDQDILISGTAGAYSYSPKLDGCYFNGESNCDYAINMDYVYNLTVSNCYSRSHNNSFIYIANRNNTLTVDNSTWEETYLATGTPTTANSRLPGTVRFPRVQGVLAMPAVNSTTVGNLMYWTASGVVSKTEAPAGKANLCVILSGGLANAYCVVSTSGVCLVNVDGATVINDTLKSGATDFTATTDNALTDPKTILGYAVSTTAGAGQAYVRIL